MTGSSRRLAGGVDMPAQSWLAGALTAAVLVIRLNAVQLAQL